MGIIVASAPESTMALNETAGALLAYLISISTTGIDGK
jgi:hypothetical protein